MAGPEIDRIDYALKAAVPSGVIFPYGGASAPSGWLLCDGSAVSRTTYADLFAAIGTTFGAGNGSTTFNLPDLRGRAPIGAGQGSGLTNRALAATGGEESHALTLAELAAHDHGGATGAGSPHSHTVTESTGGAVSADAVLGGTTLAGSTHTTSSESAHTHSVASAGSGTAHNTMPPFLALNWIIRA